MPRLRRGVPIVSDVFLDRLLQAICGSVRPLAFEKRTPTTGASFPSGRRRCSGASRTTGYSPERQVANCQTNASWRLQAATNKYPQVDGCSTLPA